jgi:hypothetical protein
VALAAKRGWGVISANFVAHRILAGHWQSFAAGLRESGQAPDGARLDFAFPRRTAAAAFDDRGETVVVFDTIDTLDARQLMAEAGAHIVSAAATREGKATVLRLQMKPGGIVRLAPDGLRWSLTLGDKGVQAAEPLLARRSFDERGQSVISLPLTQVSSVHWIGTEPGQSVAVATAYGPGASTPKVQRFVEFQIEQTVQGVAVRPVADDVMVRVGVGEVIIGRGSGLAVSAGHDKPQVPGSYEAGSNLVADQASWTDMRKGDTYAQLQELMRKAADAPRSERSVARLKLATFQLANGLHAESLGPVATVLADDPNMRNDRRAHLLRAIALTLLDRGEAAEKTLSASFLKDDAEAHIWLAVNDARLGRFPRALSSFRRSMDVLDAYPDMLQAVVRRDIFNAAIAMRDVSVADRELTLLAALAPHWTPQDGLSAPCGTCGPLAALRSSTRPRCRSACSIACAASRILVTAHIVSTRACASAGRLAAFASASERSRLAVCLNRSRVLIACLPPRRRTRPPGG